MAITPERLLEETGCPVCLQLLDAASSAPSPRDLAVCLCCASFLQFTDDLDVRLLADAELVDLPEDVRIDLRRVRRAILSTGKQERGGNVIKRKRLVTFFNCKKCAADRPPEMDLRIWARLEVGLTADGRFQVWCARHDMEVFSTEPDTVRLVQ